MVIPSPQRTVCVILGEYPEEQPGSAGCAAASIEASAPASRAIAALHNPFMTIPPVSNQDAEDGGLFCHVVIGTGKGKHQAECGGAAHKSRNGSRDYADTGGWSC